MTDSVSTRRELWRFLLVGTTTVGVDYLFYRLALLVGIDVSLAKAGGFVCGSVFAYFANRFWTFSASRPASGSVWRFSAVYGINLSVNVGLNAAVLWVFAGSGFAFTLAFLAATAVSAVLNFLGMKYLVFTGSIKGECA